MLHGPNVAIYKHMWCTLNYLR